MGQVRGSKSFSVLSAPNYQEKVYTPKGGGETDEEWIASKGRTFRVRYPQETDQISDAKSMISLSDIEKHMPDSTLLVVVKFDDDRKVAQRGLYRVEQAFLNKLRFWRGEPSQLGDQEAVQIVANHTDFRVTARLECEGWET